MVVEMWRELGLAGAALERGITALSSAAVDFLTRSESNCLLAARLAAMVMRVCGMPANSFFHPLDPCGPVPMEHALRSPYGLFLSYEESSNEQLMSFAGGASRRLDSEAPIWILRHHAPIPILAVRLISIQATHNSGFSPFIEHQYILAGDESGRVSITSLRDVRPHLFWKAHDGSVLGIDIISWDSKHAAIVR